MLANTPDPSGISVSVPLPDTALPVVLRGLGCRAERSRLKAAMAQPMFVPVCPRAPEGEVFGYAVAPATKVAVPGGSESGQHCRGTNSISPGCLWYPHPSTCDPYGRC